MPAQQLALQFDAPTRSLPLGTPLRSVALPTIDAPNTGATEAVNVVAIATTTTAVAVPVDPEKARRELERYLRASLSLRVELSITDNRRNLFSWRRRATLVTVRLHHMFLTADANTKDALASYMGGARQRLREVRRYIHDNMHQVRAVDGHGNERTRGVHHDLRGLYDSVNAQYFEGRCDASITWGKLPPRRRRRRSSMRLGSYTLGDAAIRIHPLLDDARVPEFFVASVVHHEMLHHMVPAHEVGGRLQYHSPEFRRREREFEHFELAARWEKEHIEELLRR